MFSPVKWKGQHPTYGDAVRNRDEIWEKCVSGTLQELDSPLSFSAIMTSLSLIWVWNKILIFIDIQLEGLLSTEHQKTHFKIHHSH